MKEELNMLIKEETLKTSILDKILYIEEQPISEVTIPVNFLPKDCTT